ncbi:hypothetical protein BTA51_10270 [Hahella sp. CCB-MM4]|uniref:hypothetical protein n=1 Tax=Hahella sp. (strain CCB-MM4) TaxID=1926491 RepID=UPI000B9C62F2|nr:hypothetical protein [Hahella sp. CCB-MM4]OZG73404.1 hypothetical protein BTA51_10270 [Hahella sp. CCB-MM4]
MDSYDVLDRLLCHAYMAKKEIVPDKNHPIGRRYTRPYKIKKKTVKNIWLVSGTFMLLNPSIPLIIGTTLFTAFISFSILDESL